MASSTFGHVTDWNEVIKKEARGRNDADLGEVLEVRDDIVVTEKGTLKVTSLTNISKNNKFVKTIINHI